MINFESNYLSFFRVEPNIKEDFPCREYFSREELHLNAHIGCSIDVSDIFRNSFTEL